MSNLGEAVRLAAQLACNRCVRIFEIANVEPSDLDEIHKFVSDHHYIARYDSDRGVVRLMRVTIPDKS